PLVRSAVYHAATQRDRRRAHRALSEHVSREQRAWHLAQAALGVDEDAARELEEAAAEARAHLGFVAAMAASERAAEVTADSSLRARRRVAPAQHAQPQHMMRSSRAGPSERPRFSTKLRAPRTTLR